MLFKDVSSIISIISRLSTFRSLRLAGCFLLLMLSTYYLFLLHVIPSLIEHDSLTGPRREIHFSMCSTLWLFSVAMEDCIFVWFMMVCLLKIVIFHSYSYVKQPGVIYRSRSRCIGGPLLQERIKREMEHFTITPSGVVHVMPAT